MSDNPTLDGLPEDMQTYIRSLRTENARYRTERNDYRDKYNDVSSKYTEAGNLLAQANQKLDQFATLESTAEETAKRAGEFETKHAKAMAAWGAGLTPEDIDRIQGTTPEEWKADAEKYAARIGATGRRTNLPPDPAAGGDLTTPPENDPITEAFRKKGLI